MSDRAGLEIFRLELWFLVGEGVSFNVSCLASAEFKFSGLSEYSDIWISGLYLLRLLCSELPRQFLQPSHLHKWLHGTPA